MKLYYGTGACSLSPHIVLRELGLPFDLERVDIRAKRTRTGEDFLAINPKGYVPALVLDDGQLLTEGPAIVQYLADQRPEAGLAPANGTFERVRLQEWLNFITAEIHKGYSPLFRPDVADEAKAATREVLGKKLAIVAPVLEKNQYLLGDRFTVADAYLFTVLSWSKYTGVDLARWPSLVAYVERIAARPSVVAAIEAERAK
jgi:glutathione S-transferase